MLQPKPIKNEEGYKQMRRTLINSQFAVDTCTNARRVWLMTDVWIRMGKIKYNCFTHLPVPYELYDLL